MKKKENMIRQTTPDEQEQAAEKRRKKLKRRNAMRVIDRIFGFIMATVIVVGIGCLGLEYVLLKGPSPDLAQSFAYTMFETRRFRWIPNIFLTQDEVNELQALRNKQPETVFDPSLVSIKTEEVVAAASGDENALNKYGDVDEDGDGIILENITGNGYVGYMIKVLDPKRVFISRGGSAYPLAEQCIANNALGGINAGAFLDEHGGGNGDNPDGLTIIDGQIISEGHGGDCVVGLTEDGLLVVGWFTAEEALGIGIKSCVSFGPILIANGSPLDVESSGLNPRTAIGQRDDGCILMLVVDGRQVHSYGATYKDLQDIMMEYGAVNAFNLDGGSSTTMWYNGSYVNSCSSANGIARQIPDAFLFR